MTKKHGHDQHIHCEHVEVAFCGHCDVTYCKSCKQEWGEVREHGYYWPPQYLTNPVYGTTTTITDIGNDTHTINNAAVSDHAHN